MIYRHHGAGGALSKSLEITERLGDKKETAYTLNSIGTLHSRRGTTRRRWGTFKEAWRSERKLAIRRVPATLNNIGMIHLAGELQAGVGVLKRV